jgi:hypothetical protein
MPAVSLGSGRVWDFAGALKSQSTNPPTIAFVCRQGAVAQRLGDHVALAWAVCDARVPDQSRGSQYVASPEGTIVDYRRAPMHGIGEPSPETVSLAVSGGSDSHSRQPLMLLA